MIIAVNVKYPANISLNTKDCLHIIRIINRRLKIKKQNLISFNSL